MPPENRADHGERMDDTPRLVHPEQLAGRIPSPLDAAYATLAILCFNS
jgi:hypothetical protein